MSNYINDISIYGLMNKNCFLNYDNPETLSFYKVKDKSKVTICKDRMSEDDEKHFTHISYMYLDEKPDIKGSHSMDMVLSHIVPEFFEGMKGKTYIDIRHTVNQCSKKITAEPLNSSNYNDVFMMIEKWRYDDNGGMKYGMREHAGIDKNIIRKYCLDECKALINNTFGYVFYYGDECVGYACMSKREYDTDGIKEYHYLTRKVRNVFGIRNLTEYIDWYMFKKVYEICKSDFLINWGCSSDGVLWYKTHKWPLYRLESKWFVSFYPNGKPEKK